MMLTTAIARQVCWSCNTCHLSPLTIPFQWMGRSLKVADYNIGMKGFDIRDQKTFY